MPSKNESCTHYVKWKKLITKGHMYCMIPFIWNFENKQIYGTESRLIVSKDWREEGWGSNN